MVWGNCDLATPSTKLGQGGLKFEISPARGWFCLQLQTDLMVMTVVEVVSPIPVPGEVWAPRVFSVWSVSTPGGGRPVTGQSVVATLSSTAFLPSLHYLHPPPHPNEWPARAMNTPGLCGDSLLRTQYHQGRDDSELWPLCLCWVRELRRVRVSVRMSVRVSTVNSLDWRFTTHRAASLHSELLTPLYLSDSGGWGEGSEQTCSLITKNYVHLSQFTLKKNSCEDQLYWTSWHGLTDLGSEMEHCSKETIMRIKTCYFGSKSHNCYKVVRRYLPQH